MNYKINQVVKENILDKEVAVVITDIKVEEEDIYLDGSYTKNELENLLSEETPSETLVYGKVICKNDIIKLDELQNELENGKMQINCSGCPYQRQDFKNEMLLHVIRNGEKPECDYEDDDEEGDY